MPDFNLLFDLHSQKNFKNIYINDIKLAFKLTIWQVLISIFQTKSKNKYIFIQFSDPKIDRKAPQFGPTTPSV